MKGPGLSLTRHLLDTPVARILTEVPLTYRPHLYSKVKGCLLATTSSLMRSR